MERDWPPLISAPPPISPDQHGPMTPMLEQTRCSECVARQDTQFLKDLFNDEFECYIKVRSTKHQSFAQMQRLERQRLCKKLCKKKHPPTSNPYSNLLKQVDLIKRNINK